MSPNIIESSKERYQFTWPRKTITKVNAYESITETLRPCREKSVDFDDTKNIYIEGDNLSALKILRETYLGKIKMIYIDPPYNTGKDFIYRDRFSLRLGDYANISGDYSDEGEPLVLNKPTEGMYHTNWLNMIYPRLLLARDFLSEDGAIFISVDDNEMSNLIKVCMEIFGDYSYVATFPWRKRTGNSGSNSSVTQDYEWIVCFAKPEYKPTVVSKGRKYYTTIDFPGRPWRYHDLTKQTTASERPNSYFTIVDPKNGKKYPADPNNTWRITRDTIDTYMAQKRIIFPGDYDFLSISRPVLRYFKDEDQAKEGDSFGRIRVSTKLPDYVGMSEDGTQDIVNLFGRKVFNFPKPVSLIEYLINISLGTSTEGIVLDFFSGSATTAEAVLRFNQKNGTNVSYIAVQYPEKCAEKSEATQAGFNNICEIGEERIRRAGKKIQENNSQKLDIGFRVFRIDSSNMNDVYYNPDFLSKDILDNLADNIKSDRSNEDLLFQIMMECGIELSAKIDTAQIDNKTVFSIDDGYMIVCIDPDINDNIMVDIAKKQPRYAVFRDCSMASDSIAINCSEIFKTYSPNTKIKIL